MPQNQLNHPKFFICGGILLAFIFWCCTAPALSSAADQFTPTTFHAGWSQQIRDEVIPLDSLQDYIPVDVGESLVFTCTLPTLKDDDTLLCYSENKEVRFYIDDDLLHSFVMQEGFALLDTPGSAWVQVDLNPAMSGKRSGT